MKGLTDKQELVLQYISELIRERSFPPTIREVAHKFNVTAKAAYDHLKAIEKKGYLKTSKNQSRAIELLRHHPSTSIPVQALSVPIIGRVAAGLPLLAEENIESYFPISKELSSLGTIFGLRVVGESMIQAGIHDGDIAIIQKQEIANNGETVVALIEDEATLKVFFKEQDHIRLEARNPKFSPIIARNVTIVGKLVGIYRLY